MPRNHVQIGYVCVFFQTTLLGIRGYEDYNDFLDVNRNKDSKLTRKVKSCVEKNKWCGLKSDMITAEEELKRGINTKCHELMEKHNIESVTDLRAWLKENQQVAPQLAVHLMDCAKRGKYKKRTS